MKTSRAIISLALAAAIGVGFVTLKHESVDAAPAVESAPAAAGAVKPASTESVPVSAPVAAEAAPAKTAAESVGDAAAAAPAEVRENIAMYKMGTVVNGSVFAPTQIEADRLKAEFQRKVAFYDDLLTVHRDSPLNEVNKRAGETVEVPVEVARLIERSVAIAHDSDGVFQPMIGPVVNLWKIGFGGDKVPTDEQIARAVSLVDHAKVSVTYKDGHAYARIGQGQSIDLGGIAKGYIGTALAEDLVAKGMKHGLINLGGNVVAVGEKAPGTPWSIGLQIPGHPRGEPFAIVRVADTSVVTSGAYERYFEKDGKRYAHILSPKTGRPVTTDISSVTIISKDGTFADAWCTALFAMGWDKAREYLVTHPDVACIMLNGDMKRIVATEAARPFLHALVGDYDLEFIR